MPDDSFTPEDMRMRFAAYLAEASLFGPDSKLLVGVSGGPDSVCLFHMLHRLGYDVIAAHLHHGLRKEADREMALVSAWCDELEKPIVTGKALVGEIAKDRGMSLEQAGREARKTFLGQAHARLGTDFILTAHTQDDHLETVIFNLTRGTGLTGLAGIQPMRPPYVRPLLLFTRSETGEYCRSEGLWTHDDPANTDLVHSRARIRHRVVKELELINPGVRDAVTRLSEVVNEEDRFLNGSAAGVLEASEVEYNGPLHFLSKDCEVFLSAARLRDYPETLVRRALRLVASAWGGTLDFEQTLILLNFVRTGAKGAVTLEGGQGTIEVSEDFVHFRTLHVTTPFRFPLTLPGEVVSDEFGWVLTARRVEGPTIQKGPLVASLDASRIKGELHFRSPGPSDSVHLIGQAPKPLADILKKGRLSKAAKARIPLICDMVGILWVPGHGVAERVSVSESTSTTIVVELGPSS
jgi:tRNA(Ile)-lysidine synthase